MMTGKPTSICTFIKVIIYVFIKTYKVYINYSLYSICTVDGALSLLTQHLSIALGSEPLLHNEPTERAHPMVSTCLIHGGNGQMNLTKTWTYNDCE